MSSVTKRPAFLSRALRALVIGAALSSPACALAQTQAPAQKPRPAAPQVSAIKPQPPAAAKVGEDVVAHVGGTDITAGQLRAYVEALGAREQAAIAKEPGLLNQAVRQMLSERVVLQEALAKKWDQEPKVAAQLERLRERAVVELYLQSVSVPPTGYPGEEEMQKAYDANRSAFVVPRQFQLGHIFVQAPKDADRATEDKAKKTLEEIQRKLKSGADFAAVARTESEGKDGGELGWLSEGQIRPEIRQRAMGLAKGGVSEPIQLDDGWHIVKLLDTKPSYTRPLAEAREQLAQQMRAERASMLRRAYVAELVKRNPPVVNEIALSNLLDGVRK
ncbi:peptidylprolyl isomerase [Methylosinus sp. Sm6]|uniref:peptidylprolyl isomerase n=1 Tax=Methylosinus sp. Sm6 TaxID=2866948 RepID=UPI001C9905FC|nr:peptidylprolyl isomerase [Methylosinus sp. Sm6]MBY6239907.1 peptidylprolyl isomerase [Methylosinus sp. Sm6]